MNTIGILTKEPVWEEKLSGFSGDSNFRISGSFMETDPELMIGSPVFQDSDIIWIPEYSDAALACAVRAVKLSRHIIFGFPLSMFPFDSCALVQLAHESRVQVQVGHHGHFNPAFRSVGKLIQQAQYIDLYHCTGLECGDYQSALFHSLLTDIDLCISLVPDSLKKFQSHSTFICEGSPPILNVRLEFNNGTAASIRLDPFSSFRGIDISVFQRQGILRIDMQASKATLERFNPAAFSGPGSKHEIWPVNNFPTPAIEENDPGFITGECLSFIQNLNNGLKPLSGLDQGCEAMKITRNILNKVSISSE